MKKIKVFIIAMLFLVCALAAVAFVGCGGETTQTDDSASITSSSSKVENSSSAQIEDSSSQEDDSSSAQIEDSSSQEDDSSSAQIEDSSSTQEDDSSSAQIEDSSSSQEDDSSTSQGDDSSSSSIDPSIDPEGLPEKLTILFQGDSITDNNRSRTDLTDLGGGYAAMVAKALEEVYGDSVEFTFINRANSGWNLIDDWNKGGVDHYEQEFYQYNADIATILIGYNDIMDAWQTGGVSDEDFEACYRALLVGLKERGTIAICLAPYDITQRIEYTQTEFPAKRAIIKSLAEEFDFPFIDMRPYMLKAVEDGAYKMELFGDLTHPWAAGCRIISELVIDKISAVIDKDYETPEDLGEYRPLSTVADNEDDLTNVRAFFAAAHGKAEYDTETFYSTDEFVSTKSLKVIHEEPDPYSSNAYTSILFDFSASGKKNLTNGSLVFNLKVDNFIAEFTIQAFSALETRNSNYSSSYRINLLDSGKCKELNDGWYEVTVNLNNWASKDETGVLDKAIALVVTMSKGENADVRATFDIDGKKDSVFWIDNLVLDLTTNPEDAHASQDTLTAGVNYTIAVDRRAYNTIYFEYKITTEADTYFQLVILDGWGDGIGYFKFNSAGADQNYAGVSTFKDEEGYVHVTISVAAVSKIWGSSKPDGLTTFFIRGDWSTSSGYIDNLRFTI